MVYLLQKENGISNGAVSCIRNNNRIILIESQRFHESIEGFGGILNQEQIFLVAIDFLCN